MSDSSTVELHKQVYDTEDSATGEWSNDTSNRRFENQKFHNKGIIKNIIVTLFTAPASAVKDPWNEQRLLGDVITVSRFFDNTVSRPISRFEALMISKQIIEEAESERAQLIELEAKRGIIWKDED